MEILRNSRYGRRLKIWQYSFIMPVVMGAGQRLCFKGSDKTCSSVYSQ
jgi:hypothetical protein